MFSSYYLNWMNFTFQNREKPKFSNANFNLSTGSSNCTNFLLISEIGCTHFCTSRQQRRELTNVMGLSEGVQKDVQNAARAAEMSAPIEIVFTAGMANDLPCRNIHQVAFLDFTDLTDGDS